MLEHYEWASYHVLPLHPMHTDTAIVNLSLLGCLMIVLAHKI